MVSDDTVANQTYGKHQKNATPLNYPLIKKYLWITTFVSRLC